MEYVLHKGKKYPALQASGFAARFAFAFAKEYCKGSGYDIGYCKEEWKLEGAIPIDMTDENEFHALHLPTEEVDYIFSSHMLEHYQGRWQDVLEYWLTKLRNGGIIFLYLPNCEYQEYWAFGNKKHVHYMTPHLLQKWCEYKGLKYIVTNGYDLNGSFYTIIENEIY